MGHTLADFEQDLADNLYFERGTTVESASAHDAYWTLAVTIRDRLAERRARTAEAHYVTNPKFVYYLSAEYMLGRQLRQNAMYTGTTDLARQALATVGVSADALRGPGRGAGAGERGPGPAGRLPARLAGDPRHTGGGVRHPV